MATGPAKKEPFSGKAANDAAMMNALLERAKQEISGLKDFYVALARMREERKYSPSQAKDARDRFDAFYRKASGKIEKEMKTLEALWKAEGNESLEVKFQYMRLLFATYYLEKVSEMFERWEKNPSISHCAVLTTLYDNLGRVFDGSFFSMDPGSLIRLFFDLKAEFDACSEIFGVAVAGDIGDLPKMYRLMYYQGTGEMFIAHASSTPASRSGA